MDFRGGQPIGPFFSFDDHTVPHLGWAFRPAQIPHLVLCLGRETNRDNLAFRSFDFHVGRIDRRDDSEHMLPAAMSGHQSGGAEDKQGGDEESKDSHG